ncbi:hypothetical protein MKZ38_009427 [Zalerion maritima]|uniref:Uncharacterized protein n=1 Tax=Zalerion maritima TaxID=339359 RepID=A0AAD5WN54_9PEZI|nr:hypothetical protein MKZ38_009427 [Zalerion maritima]
MPSKPTALGSAAEDRKTRLAKLKSLKRKQPTDEVVPPESAREGSAPPPPPPPPASEVPSPPAAPTFEEQAQDAPVQATEPAPTSRGRAEGEEEDLDPEADVSRILLSGRNYDASARGPKLGFEAPPLGPHSPSRAATLENKAREIEAEARRRAQEEQTGEQGVDLFKLQPKKQNWDLKRDLDEKLEVLSVRTQNAINKIVRERIDEGRKAAKATGGDGNGNGKAGAGTSGKKVKGMGQDGEGVDGVALVEGLKVRERAEEEEERREREDIEMA